MKHDQNTPRDYIQDLAEIRSMMEKTSRFLSLSGWSGVLAGVYALIAVGVVYFVWDINPNQLSYAANDAPMLEEAIPKLLLLGMMTLILAVATSTALSAKNAVKSGLSVWNPATRQMVIHLVCPLVTGAVLILFLLAEGFYGLVAPLTMIFYGLALFYAGKFTFGEIKYLGLIQVTLGLIAVWLVEFSLLIWAIGFGFVHIVYGYYMHFRYKQ